MATRLRTKFKSAKELVDGLFDAELTDSKFDPEVVSLVREHLSPAKLASKAGLRLADALVDLARQRAAVSRT